MRAFFMYTRQQWSTFSASTVDRILLSLATERSPRRYWQRRIVRQKGVYAVVPASWLCALLELITLDVRATVLILEQPDSFWRALLRGVFYVCHPLTPLPEDLPYNAFTRRSGTTEKPLRLYLVRYWSCGSWQSYHTPVSNLMQDNPQLLCVEQTATRADIDALVRNKLNTQQQETYRG